jgi:hypothetical protein
VQNDHSQSRRDVAAPVVRRIDWVEVFMRPSGDGA